MPFLQALNKKRIGAQKEKQALTIMQSQGYLLIEQNFHCKFGEIDLIMQEPSSQQFVFVEVRYRKSQKFGGAAASVSKSKQQKVKNSALFYLSQRNITPSIRFDVFAFEGEQHNWIQSAF